ncbi:MAG: ABC transporter permease [Chloroflexi bacterium]|nr:ABC transporter permease [Chloroflexota bacterium]
MAERHELSSMVAAGRGRRMRAVGLLLFARHKPLGMVGGVIVLLLILVAITAPLISPYDPLEVNSKSMLEPPSGAHLFGTDQAGRDVLSRVMWGARVALWVGIVSVGIGTAAGIFFGLPSYWAGAFDLAIQRVMDGMLSFPTLILAITLVAVLGPGITNAMIAIGIVMVPQMARLVRGSVLSVRENTFVEAATALGARDKDIIWRHVLPNIMAPIIVMATASLGRAILVEASLSFLGLGTQPPTPSWGADLSGPGRAYMEIAPWLATFPGVAVSLVVLGINLYGDALRDVLDPRLRTER